MISNDVSIVFQEQKGLQDSKVAPLGSPTKGVPWRDKQKKVRMQNPRGRWFRVRMFIPSNNFCFFLKCKIKHYMLLRIRFIDFNSVYHCWKPWILNCTYEYGTSIFMNVIPGLKYTDFACSGNGGLSHIPHKVIFILDWIYFLWCFCLTYAQLRLCMSKILYV